jgi:hypothetical protein
MKYFTPELLARCRSLDDDVADAAALEWEKAIAAYQARIRVIRLRFPANVRRLLGRVSLHDAKVLAITVGKGSPRFTLLVRLEGSASRPGTVLELDYLLVAGPWGGVAFRKPAQFGNGAAGLGWVLHDEFDLDEDRAFFTHSLLLSGGDEIAVRFHGLSVRQLDEAFVSPLGLTEGEKTWPLVEAG